MEEYILLYSDISLLFLFFGSKRITIQYLTFASSTHFKFCCCCSTRTSRRVLYAYGKSHEPNWKMVKQYRIEFNLTDETRNGYFCSGEAT